MRLWIAPLSIWLGLVLSPEAQSQVWHIGDESTFPAKINELPAERQRSILAHIEPSLTRMVQENLLDRDEIKQVEKSLRVAEVETATVRLLMVQSWGSELCGAVGNCAVWVLGDHDRALLEGAGGDKVAILHTLHHGLPSILISTHNGASQATLAWYRFDGFRYRNVVCETTETLWWEPHPRRLIRHVPCAK